MGRVFQKTIRRGRIKNDRRIIKRERREKRAKFTKRGGKRR